MTEVPKAAGQIGQPSVDVDHAHIGLVQAQQGMDPTIGAGGPTTAPAELPPADAKEPVVVGAAAAAILVWLIEGPLHTQVPGQIEHAIVVVVVAVGAWVLRSKVTPSD